MAKNSGPVRTVHARTTGKERDEMIATTKAEIEKKFGQGSIMRYGDGGPELEVEAIPTGALALDAALGIGGVPRGRIVEIYGPESSGKTTLCSRSWPKPRQWVAWWHLSMPSTRSIPRMPRALAWISTRY